jgi:endonuclease YncB( thermonuclease family)
VSDVPYRPGAVWRITAWTVIDGDTIRAFLMQESIDSVEEVSGLLVEHVHRRRTNPRVYPRGIPIRLINLDTPESRDDPVGWRKAKDELAGWLAARSGRLCVETWEMAGGFDRWLGDIFTEGRGEPSASEWMLSRGWSPYLTAKQKKAARDAS